MSPATPMNRNDTLNEYEVIVGFAGSSRTTVELVEATDRGEAGRLAREGHGCTAVAQEIFEL